MQLTLRDDLSPVVLEYLELIYTLHAEGEDAFGVTLAEQLGVSRANASATVQRMVRDGLVQVEGRRISLTTAGRAQAEAGLRRHRVTERFLVEILGIPWATVHQQARSFERGLSPLLEERMDARLGYPRTCPHGNPIPRDDLDAASYLQTRGAQRLTDVSSGARVETLLISELAETTTALMRLCAEVGILPGARLHLETPIDAGTVRVHSTGGSVSMLPNQAARIWVIPLPAEREEV